MKPLEGLHNDTNWKMKGSMNSGVSMQGVTVVLQESLQAFVDECWSTAWTREPVVKQAIG